MPSELLRTTAWAIEPETFKIVDQVISAKLLGRDHLDGIEAAHGAKFDARPDKSYVVVQADNGASVAVIPMLGVIGKRMNLMTRYSGGVSTEYLQMQIMDAVTDPSIDALVLKTDSPGGTVDGTVELADWLASIRGEKTMYAYVDGMMASAAWWIGSQFDAVHAYRTAQIGSTGVVIAHYDRSGADEKAGVKRTFITSGEYKRIAADNEPLNEKGEAYLQQMVDQYYSMFVDGVAAGRSLSPQEVQDKFGDAKLHIAADALKIGMIDEVSDLAATIEAAAAAAREHDNMNKAEILQKYPEAAAEILEDGKAQALEDFEAEVTGQVDEAVSAEQTRMTGLYGALHGEDEAKNFGVLVETGVGADQVQALTAMGFGKSKTASGDSGETNLKKEILDSLDNDDETDLEAGGGGNAPQDFMAAVKAYSKDNGVSMTKAMSVVRKESPGLHTQYLKKQKDR